MKPKRTWRALLGTGLALAILLLAASAYVWVQLRRSLPELDGALRLEGLGERVTVTRDAHGIPTLQAASEADAFLALGFVHAQDRFFQMELQRRTGQGRLSELFGAGALESDRLLRRFGLARAAASALEASSPRTRVALEAYSKGVNAWLARHRSSLPPEFFLLGLMGVTAEPEPWQPADCLLTAKLLSWSLSGDYERELVRADIEAKVGEAGASVLYPPYPRTAPVIVETSRPDEGKSPPPVQDQPDVAAGSGSNNWVVGPSRTTTGHPLLANDPHMGAHNPNWFYLVRLDAPGYHVVGATVPGFPPILIGRNERIAWGVTNLGPDTQDLYLEKVDPADPARYLFRGESLPFLRRTEHIVVAGAPAVDLEVRETRRGPVLEENWEGKGPLSLRWTALDANDTTAEAFLEMGRAKDWSSFRQAVSLLVTPAQNFVYADVDGHIGYSASGRIPIRPAGAGRIPQQGWDSPEWSGFIPFDQLPQALDPPDGFIATANNEVVRDDSRAPLAVYWDSYRAMRIRELLLARPKVDPEYILGMQRDKTSLIARDLLPRLLATKAADPAQEDALRMLREWDQVDAEDSPAAALFMTWYYQLLGRIVADDLGAAVYEKYAMNRPTVLVNVLGTPLDGWCDDKATPAPESCADLLSATLGEALQELTRDQGAEPNGWRLDRLQRARFVNPVGSEAPLIGSLFVREVPVGGDSSSIHAIYSSYGAPHRVTILQSLLVQFDLSPGGETRVLIPMGQSGHPLSPHYDDLLESWRTTTLVVVGSGTGKTLVLDPSLRPR